MHRAWTQARRAGVIASAFVVAFTSPALSATTGLIPLSTLGTNQHQGFSGGLYAEGRNAPHGAHAEALRKMSAAIRPLDANGRPDATGKAVIVGIGASVCVQIFKTLEEIAPVTPGASTKVVFVNCAKGGHDVNKLSDPERHYWESARASVEKSGCSPAQVQVAWYQSDELRDTRDDFPGRPQRLQQSIAKNMRELKQHFPNVRLCYHSARHTTAFSPDTGVKQKHGEPRPYHVGWAVKWLIEEQSSGKADLRFEGPNAVTPLVAWADYFWTDADQPRHDGYRWSPADVVKDGVHLSDTGKPRVANELIEFWRTDPYAKVWFAGNAQTTTAPTSKSGTSLEAKTKPQILAAQSLKPGEPALLINGKSKFAKLERLLTTRDGVRLLVWDRSGKQVLEVADVFNQRTDLNELLSPGDYKLHFLGTNGQQIKMTMDVPEVVKLR